MSNLDSELLAPSIRKIDLEVDNMASGLPQKLQNQIPGLSRTFLGHFLGLFQDCLSFFFLRT